MKACPFDPSHDRGEASIQVAAEGKASFKCKHDSCRQRKWSDLASLFEGRAEQLSGFAVKPVSFAEIWDKDYEIEYLVDGMLVADHPCVLGGPRKCLKTSLLVDLGVSLASNSPFMGRFGTSRPLRVWLLSGESGEPTLHETVKRITRSKGLDRDDVQGFFFQEQLPKFNQPADLAKITSGIQEYELDVVIFDPAYLSMPSDNAEKLMAQGQLLRDATQAVLSVGATPIIAHHFKKSTRNVGPPDLDDLAWSGWAEFARQWILVGRTEPYAGFGIHKLQLVAGGSMGHSCIWNLNVREGEGDIITGRKWEVEVKPYVSPEQKAKRDKEREIDEERHRELMNILETIYSTGEGSPPGLSLYKLVQYAGWGRDRIRNLVDELVEEGILFTSRGRSGTRKAEIYHLTEEGHKFLEEKPIEEASGDGDEPF